MRIAYVYPKKQRVSFNIVARQHIEQLRKRGYDVVEVDINDPFAEIPVKRALVHPIFYPLAGHPAFYRRVLRSTEALIGFDVCDTDKISPLAAYIASQFDCVAVPTSFCKRVYGRSGVMSRVEVVPHGINKEFYREPRETRDPDIKKIASKRGFKILFFLWHSGFRKGADVVAEAFARLVKERQDIWLIVKLAGLIDPFTQYMFNIPNVILINKWLDSESLVDLYDIADIVVVPSRGGGFEINALEALARAKPTIVSDWGSFLDYCRVCYKVKSRNHIDLFVGDKTAKVIHDGKGVDPDPRELYAWLKYVIENYEQERKKFEDYRRIVLQVYSWDRIGLLLDKIIRTIF